MLLTAIAERAEMRGWISVNVTDRDGMLSEIIVQLRQKASHILAPETNSWLSEIHVHGVGSRERGRKCLLRGART